MRSALLAIAIGLGCLGIAFQTEIAAAVRVWSDSTAYNHCFLVLPIALFLAWERRERLSQLTVTPVPWLAFLAIPLAAAWLVAERVGVMEGRQLVALTMVLLLFVTVLGWHFARAFAAPMAYLYFLVPFGAFLTPALQDFTAKFTTIGLNLLRIPNYTDGYIIEIPAGTFYVAEACAGLRFLIASIAFGALYALTIYRSPWRRLAFLAVSVIIPIVANGFRALGIVVLGQILGSAEAAAADHIIYGWIFFSVVILLLTLAGLPFREDHKPIGALPRQVGPENVRGPDPTIRDVSARPARSAGFFAAAAMAVLLAVLGPLAAFGFDSLGKASRAATLPDALGFSNCTAAPDAGFATTESSRQDSDAGSVSRRYLCDDGRIALRLTVMPARSSPSRVVEQQRQMIAGSVQGESDQHWLNIGQGEERATWLLNEAEDNNDAVATALWLNGRAARLGLTDRVTQARNSILGGTKSPVIAAVSLQSDPASAQRRGARREIEAFLKSDPQLAEEIARLSK